MSAQSDHEAFLRAALHAAADSLEVRGGGLQRIRARVQQPRPTFVTRAQAIGNEVLLRTPAWLQDVFYQVAAVVEDAWQRLSPPPAPGRHRSRAQGWLRPVAAMAIVMFVVAAVTYVAIDAATTVSPSSSNSHSGGGAISHHSHSPSPTASHLGDTSAPVVRHSSSPRTSSRPTASATPKTSASTSPSPSVSPSSSPSPSVSPSGTGSSPSSGPAGSTAAGLGG